MRLPLENIERTMKLMLPSYAPHYHQLLKLASSNMSAWCVTSPTETHGGCAENVEKCIQKKLCFVIKGGYDVELVVC